jgi:hypothetical protein
LGRADVLDAAGGTAIFQMAPARLHITQGQDALRCLRLSPKGMVRWYTDCCRTPVANTVAGRLPFVGLIVAFMDFESAALERNAVLGQPALILGKFAIGGLPNGAHPTMRPRLLLRIATRLATWWLSGKGQPSPLWDAQYQPRVPPTVLTPEQRASLRAPAQAADARVARDHI